jgi:hypothetical protein
VARARRAAGPHHDARVLGGSRSGDGGGGCGGRRQGKRGSGLMSVADRGHYDAASTSLQQLALGPQDGLQQLRFSRIVREACSWSWLVDVRAYIFIWSTSGFSTLAWGGHRTNCRRAPTDIMRRTERDRRLAAEPNFFRRPHAVLFPVWLNLIMIGNLTRSVNGLP